MVENIDLYLTLKRNLENLTLRASPSLKPSLGPKDIPTSMPTTYPTGVTTDRPTNTQSDG